MINTKISIYKVIELKKKQKLLIFHKYLYL